MRFKITLKYPEKPRCYIGYIISLDISAAIPFTCSILNSVQESQVFSPVEDHMVCGEMHTPVPG